MRMRCRKYVRTADTRRARVDGARPAARIAASQRSRSSTVASPDASARNGPARPGRGGTRRPCAGSVARQEQQVALEVVVGGNGGHEARDRFGSTGRAPALRGSGDGGLYSAWTAGVTILRRFVHRRIGSRSERMRAVVDAAAVASRPRGCRSASWRGRRGRGAPGSCEVGSAFERCARTHAAGDAGSARGGERCSCRGGDRARRERVRQRRPDCELGPGVSKVDGRHAARPPRRAARCAPCRPCHGRVPPRAEVEVREIEPDCLGAPEEPPE